MAKDINDTKVDKSSSTTKDGGGGGGGGKSRFRLFKGGKKKSTSQSETTEPKVSSAVVTNDKNDEFSLDAIGKQNTFTTASIPSKTTATTATVPQQSSTITTAASVVSTGGSHLIPLVPLHDALTIDSSPLGRADETASQIGSVTTASKSILKQSTGSNVSTMTTTTAAAVGTTTTTASTKTSGRDSDTKRSSTSSKKKQVSNVKRTWFSFVCRTRRFRKICDSVFVRLDTSKRSSIDFTSIDKFYEAVLLVHLQLGSYYGPAACSRLLSRDQLKKVIQEQRHTIRMSSLNKDEFRDVMMNSFSTVMIRITIQWYLSILFVPIFARYLLHNATVWYPKAHAYLLATDQYAIIASVLEDVKDDAAMYKMKLTEVIPDQVMFEIQRAIEIISSVPQSVWESVYLAMMCTFVGLFYMPYIVFIADSVFRWIGGI